MNKTLTIDEKEMLKIQTDIHVLTCSEIDCTRYYSTGVTFDPFFYKMWKFEKGFTCPRWERTSMNKTLTIDEKEMLKIQTDIHVLTCSEIDCTRYYSTGVTFDPFFYKMWKFEKGFTCPRWERTYQSSILLDAIQSIIFKQGQ